MKNKKNIKDDPSRDAFENVDDIAFNDAEHATSSAFSQATLIRKQIIRVETEIEQAVRDAEALLNIMDETLDDIMEEINAEFMMKGLEEPIPSFDTFILALDKTILSEEVPNGDNTE